MIVFQSLSPYFQQEDLGLIPFFLSNLDLRSAKEQIEANYAHGGGWNPQTEFEMISGNRLKYPGDPIMKPLAKAQLREETIFFYEHAYLAIVQTDGSFEAARVD